VPELLDGRLIEALKHPTRAHVLNVLTQRVASATEVAREMDEEPSALIYHFRTLEKLECIEEVRKKKRRGATERFYRATVRHFFDRDAWGSVPMEERLGIVLNVVGLISGDVGEAVRAETLTNPDLHISRTVMELDTAGWAEVLDLLEAALEELLEIRGRAAKRMSESGEKPRIGKATLLHFETPDGKRS